MNYTQRHISQEEYFEWIGKYFGVGDTLTCIDGSECDDDFASDGDEVVVFKNYGGCILNMYNKDTETERCF